MPKKPTKSVRLMKSIRLISGGELDISGLDRLEFRQRHDFSEKSVKQAFELVDRRPDLAERVESGEFSVQWGHKVMLQDQTKREGHFLKRFFDGFAWPAQ